MDIPGFKVKITPVCVANHGAENRVDCAFELLRQRIIRSLAGYPEATIEVTYTIKDV